MKLHLGIRKTFHYEGLETLEQVAQIVCGASILGDTQWNIVLL